MRRIDEECDKESRVRKERRSFGEERKVGKVQEKRRNKDHPGLFVSG